MDKEEILKEIEKEFDLTKKWLGFKSSLEEIDERFYIKEYILKEGFVSNKFSRQMINEMVGVFYSWIGEIYSWIYPPQMDFIHGYENKRLSQEEKKEFLQMIDRIMYLVRKNKRIAFKGLIKEEESKFIDDLVSFDKEFFNPFMIKYHEKFEKVWEEEVNKENH